LHLICGVGIAYRKKEKRVFEVEDAVLMLDFKLLTRNFFALAVVLGRTSTRRKDLLFDFVTEIVIFDFI
jgi:hypothetical protein